MSGKILELLRKIDEASSRQECFSVQRLTDDLRVFLAAPVVERQPAIYMEIDELALFTSEHVSGGVAAVSKRPGEGMTALYTAPPELAELQATIARLTAENDRLKKELNHD
jgi:hypothetical protein